MPDRPVAAGNPYVTLGLEPSATMAEVKRAYRRLAKAYHPDSAGEAALPRFLAIHEAYEAIRTGRPMARSRAGTAAPERAEPWRADPERARAARERASRRGAPPPGSGPRSSAGSGGASTAGAGARAAGTGSANAGGGTSGPAGTTGTSGRARGGRKHVRKATLGSTTYDEARDANDPSWSGASWYGPSTGEYWIVNPREYADPRKHGPEYQSRARRPLGAADGGGAPDAEGPGGPGEEGAPDAGAPVGAASSAGSPRARAQASSAGARATPWTFDRERSRTASTGTDELGAAADAASGHVGPAPGAGARAREWGAAWPADARSIRRPRGRSLLGSTPRDWIGGPADDPVRRLGIALVAWPPLGLAAAALIGDVTGCTLYAAECTGTEPLLPWLAQAVILGLLLLLPPLARVLAGGSIGVLFALVPVTAFLVAVGASGAPQAGFALAFLLGAAWLAGSVWAAWRGLRAGGVRTAA